MTFVDEYSGASMCVFFDAHERMLVVQFQPLGDRGLLEWKGEGMDFVRCLRVHCGKRASMDFGDEGRTVLSFHEVSPSPETMSFVHVMAARGGAARGVVLGEREVADLTEYCLRVEAVRAARKIEKEN